MINRVKLAAQLRKQRRTLRGIGYDPALALSYARSLFPIVRYITKLAEDYVKELKSIGLVQDNVSSFANYMAPANRKWIADQAGYKAASAVKKLDKAHKDRFMAEFRDKAGIDLKKIVVGEKLETALQPAIDRNVALITRASEDQIQRVNTAIQSSILSGSDSASLYQSIRSIGDVFESRAKLIARDQTSKLLGELNSARQTQIGIPGYYWRTAGDDAVRDSHAELDGQYFAWNSPPSVGNPGEDIQCRCVADPAIDKFLTGLPDEE